MPDKSNKVSFRATRISGEAGEKNGRETSAREDEDVSLLERVTEFARENPKAAIGAGIALVAGAIASLAWPPKPKKAARNISKRPVAKARGGGTRNVDAAKAAKPQRSRRKASTKTAARRTNVKANGARKPQTSTNLKATPGGPRSRKPRSDKGVRRPRRSPKKADASPTN